MKREVELAAAEALLDAGISLPFLSFRLPWGRRICFRLIMRRPCLGSQMRIARQYLKLGVTARQFDSMSVEEEKEFFVRHGHRLSQMLALTICRGYLSGLLLTPLVAWLLRWRVPRPYLLEAQRWFRELRGTKDFMTIIVLAERSNPFRAETSRERNDEKGS